MTGPTERVIFRTYPEGDVIALLPDQPCWRAGRCTCYQRVGQHGTADYTAVVASTRRATPDEYAPLLRELERIGYNLRVGFRARVAPGME